MSVPSPTATSTVRKELTMRKIVAGRVEHLQQRRPAPHLPAGPCLMVGASPPGKPTPVTRHLMPVDGCQDRCERTRW